MGFIDSYKHLEKLCGDMLQTQHGVSAYIAEMESTPNGSYWVQGWVQDLKCLKHYRWVRNQIVHDPNSSEENMCCLSDAQWIQRQAMEVGSMAGWDVPGADPAKYQENYPKMGGMDLG